MLTSHVIATLLSAFGGYLLGSIPFGLLLTRAAGLGDIRAIGSGNIGATNVLRTGNKALAALTLLLDMAKGLAAVWFVPVLALAIPTMASPWTVLQTPPAGPGIAILELYAKLGIVAGLGAFLGHLYPIWLGFRGGKGVATYIGVVAALVWPAALVFCALWLVVAAATRYSSAAALAASIVTPASVWLLGGGTLTALAMAGLTLLLFWKHWPNITRLRAGTESRIGDASR